jgi:3',5'-cyclic AMP phosphodiesterase CpdA
MNYLRSISSVSVLWAMCTLYIFAQIPSNQDFSFVFMTDIHLQYERNAIEGFNKAIDSVNKLNPDFVLTGGDMINDALKAKHSKADSLYSLYLKLLKRFQMPVYNTIGNHELYGLYKESGADPLHSDYNTGMYKRYIGKTYYSFDHKGWHFIILKSIVEDTDSTYLGYIDDEQIEWLKNDLEKIDKEIPVIVSTHIPFVTSYNQFRKGSMAPNDEGLVVANSRDILLMLYPYNLKLVLQGHLHIIEEINMQNRIRFLVGGAVCARWWKGLNQGMEEGFMKIDIRDGEVYWDYIDYGWEAVLE